MLDKLIEGYRADYAAYYERCKHVNSPAIRDPTTSSAPPATLARNEGPGTAAAAADDDADAAAPMAEEEDR